MVYNSIIWCDCINLRPLSSTQTSEGGISSLSSYQLYDVDELCTMVQKWLQETINIFENENTNMIEQVCEFFFIFLFSFSFSF